MPIHWSPTTPASVPHDDDAVQQQLLLLPRHDEPLLHERDDDDGDDGHEHELRLHDELLLQLPHDDDDDAIADEASVSLDHARAAQLQEDQEIEKFSIMII